MRYLVMLLLVLSGCADAPAGAAASELEGYDPVPGVSVYGPDDQSGASNTQTPAKALEAMSRMFTRETFRVAHDIELGMPQFPGTPIWELQLPPPIVVLQQAAIQDQLIRGVAVGQLGTQLDSLGHFAYLASPGDPFEESLFYNLVTGAADSAALVKAAAELRAKTAALAAALAKSPAT